MGFFSNIGEGRKAAKDAAQALITGAGAADAIKNTVGYRWGKSGLLIGPLKALAGPLKVIGVVGFAAAVVGAGMAWASSARSERRYRPQPQDQNMGFDGPIMQAPVGYGMPSTLMGEPLVTNGPMGTKVRGVPGQGPSQPSMDAPQA